jgi:hypothetical protein
VPVAQQQANAHEMLANLVSHASKSDCVVLAFKSIDLALHGSYLRLGDTKIKFFAHVFSLNSFASGPHGAPSRRASMQYAGICALPRPAE